MTQLRTERRLAAIVAADVVGYSRLMRDDEAATLASLRRAWAEAFNPIVAAHGGRIVKTMGDGALVEFSSAVDAVECAVAFQLAMPKHNEQQSSRVGLEFRIGINLGDVIIDGDDILGDGVNVAARLESMAPIGGVLVSDAVHAQVVGKIGIVFSEMGGLNLKNIAAPVRAWSWTADPRKPETPKAEPRELGNLPSIAVLPFQSMSSDPEQAYFADGLVEDIITTLSKLSDMRVIARNSTFAYKGQAVDVREIARQLGVRYVLEGSVRRSADRIRVTTQLIDATDGSHVWAERYDRSIEDIFAVQDEITLVLATEMQVKLTEGEQARLRYTTTGNVEAWTRWVQGLSHFNRSVTDENMSAALASWMRAIALDPDSASLHAMVGFIHYLDARFGWWDDRLSAQQKARNFADQAMRLDPDNADANVTSSLSMLLNGQYEEATEMARRAVRLAPGSAHAATMACFVLAFAGHAKEAVSHGERALTLSPNHPGYFLGTVGNAYRLAGRTEDAINAFQTYHAKAPGFGLVDLVLVYEQNGRHEDALTYAELLLSIRRNFTINGWASTQFRADKEGLQNDVAALAAAGLPTG
jgi:adenylate cyclase